MGSHVTNTWQETHIAVESVMEVAEGRHQGVIHIMTSMAEQNHRAEVAQLTGEAERLTNKPKDTCVLHSSQDVKPPFSMATSQATCPTNKQPKHTQRLYTMK